MHDILSMYPEELTELMLSMGQKPFRAKQITEWIYKGVDDFDKMTNLPSSLTERLKSECFIGRLNTERKLVSKIDGTVKYLFSMSDGECVETVLMRYKHGNSVCVSTQAGCRMGCSFCASTINGFRRNLSASEILLQVMTAERDTGEKISNIVLMGIGEPLDNYDNVLRFLRIVNLKDGMNIGMRHISLSTCGLVDRMDMLAKEKLQITLSVSLHACNDERRRQIMPIAQKWSYDELLAACERYEKATGRRISFEYALISGVNDSDADAAELGGRLKGTLCHVNLIPVNPVAEKSYKKSNRARTEAFVKTVESFGISTTVRRKLGSDINASCGQLRAEHATSPRNDV